jgi:hypothetical protein
MNQFRKRLEGSNGLSILREVRDGEKRLICYTSFSDSESLWQIVATDGVDVWSLSLSEQELRNLGGAEPDASFVGDVSCCLERGELGLLWTASHLTLCLKIATPPLELKLYELSAAQCRLQLQGLVFDLWARLDSAHSKLADCQKQLATKETRHEEHIVVENTKPTAGNSRAKRPIGASLVNPSLKRYGLVECMAWP